MNYNPPIIPNTYPSYYPYIPQISQNNINQAPLYYNNNIYNNNNAFRNINGFNIMPQRIPQGIQQIPIYNQYNNNFNNYPNYPYLNPNLNNNNMINKPIQNNNITSTNIQDISETKKEKLKKIKELHSVFSGQSSSSFINIEDDFSEEENEKDTSDKKFKELKSNNNEIIISKTKQINPKIIINEGEVNNSDDNNINKNINDNNNNSNIIDSNSLNNINIINSPIQNTQFNKLENIMDSLNRNPSSPSSSSKNKNILITKKKVMFTTTKNLIPKEEVNYTFNDIINSKKYIPPPNEIIKPNIIQESFFYSYDNLSSVTGFYDPFKGYKGMLASNTPEQDIKQDNENNENNENESKNNLVGDMNKKEENNYFEKINQDIFNSGNDNLSSYEIDKEKEDKEEKVEKVNNTSKTMNTTIKEEKPNSDTENNNNTESNKKNINTIIKTSIANNIIKSEEENNQEEKEKISEKSEDKSEEEDVSFSLIDKIIQKDASNKRTTNNLNQENNSFNKIKKFKSFRENEKPIIIKPIKRFISERKGKILFKSRIRYRSRKSKEKEILQPKIEHSYILRFNIEKKEDNNVSNKKNNSCGKKENVEGNNINKKKVHHKKFLLKKRLLPKTLEYKRQIMKNKKNKKFYKKKYSQINDILEAHSKLNKENKKILNNYFPDVAKDENVKYILYRNKLGEIYGFLFDYQIFNYLFFNCMDKNCGGIARYNLENKNFYLCRRHNLNYDKHESVYNMEKFTKNVKTLKSNTKIDTEIIF